MSLDQFQILQKLGKVKLTATSSNLSQNWILGDGSYSSVYRVKRLEDGLDYALKKVKI